jgi:hypothetical protein
MMRRAWFSLLVLACGPAACNAILGHQPGTLIEPDASDAAQSEAASGHDASQDVSVDGNVDAPATTDAGVDVASDAEGGCGDTQTSPDDCGTCGHSCLGGACVGGQCQPALIAGDPNNYVGLFSLYACVIVQSTFYGTDWNGQALVYRIPIPHAGATPPDAGVDFIVPLGTRDDRGLGLGTDGTKLFYGIFAGNGAGVWSVNFDGTSDNLVQGASIPQIVVADATYGYWTSWGAGGAYGPGVFQAHKDGTGSVTQALSSVEVASILPDNGQLLIAEATAGVVVVAHPSDLNTTQPLHAPLANQVGQQMQVQDLFVYFTDIQADFFRVPRTPVAQPPQAQQLHPTGALPAGTPFVVDSTDVYSLGGKQIVRFANDGSGTAKLLVKLNDTAVCAVQDKTSIYYTTYGNEKGLGPPYAAVWRFAK